MTFKITGPGKYRCRNGSIAEVKKNYESDCYQWEGVSSGNVMYWTHGGKYWSNGEDDGRDIVSRMGSNAMQVGETYEDMSGRIVHCLFERNNGTFACTGQDACGADLPERAFYYECNGTICGHDGSSDRSVKWPEPEFVVDKLGWYETRGGTVIRVLAFDEGEEFCVIGRERNDVHVDSWRADGKYTDDDDHNRYIGNTAWESDYDLIKYLGQLKENSDDNHGDGN